MAPLISNPATKMAEISTASVAQIPFSMATVSLGTPDTLLEQKIKVLADAGFKGIELGFPDLLNYSTRFLSRPESDIVGEKEFDALSMAAADVARMCTERGMKVMMLQPFSNYEGWKQGSKEREDACERAKGWIQIMKAAKTDLLQVGSTDTPAEKLERDSEVAIKDLQELADMLAKEGFRMAYEPWCWATRAPTWKDTWEVVKKIDRPNVGLCLDTFQIAGGEYADPTTESGLVGNMSPDDVGERFGKSLEELTATVPGDKIYLLQISDAWKPKIPIDKKPNAEGLRPRGVWSHDYRPLPFEGGYLPIIEVARAVLATGARTWWSVEVFDGGPQGTDDRENIGTFANKSMKSVKKLLDTCAEVA